MAEQLTPAPLSSSSSDLKSRIKATYDALAPKYNEWTIPHSTTKLHYLDLLLTHLPTSSSSSSPNPTTTNPTTCNILELGCGHGLPVTAKLLSYPHFTVTANDLSSEQIKLARKNLLADPDIPSDPSNNNNSNVGDSSNNKNRLTLLEGDMLSLIFSPESFHAVVAMYSIIHLPRAEQVSMLQQIVKWLKPGGLVLANFGAEESGEEGQVVGDWLGEHGEDGKGGGWMFWSGWGVEGTVRVMVESGLEVVRREVVVDRDEGGDVRFLWVLARKRVGAERVGKGE